MTKIKSFIQSYYPPSCISVIEVITSVIYIQNARCVVKIIGTKLLQKIIDVIFMYDIGPFFVRSLYYFVSYIHWVSNQHYS